MELVGKILRESFPVLLLTTLGGILAGVMLEGMVDDLRLVPGLIILLPAILGNRGNISGALGSRLASALHLGLIRPELKWETPLKENIYSALILNVIMSIILGVVAYYTYILVGFSEPASILQLTLISLIAGSSAGFLLSILSVTLALATYSYGYDPDNVLAPSLSTVGDILTVLCLLFATKLVLAI